MRMQHVVCFVPFMLGVFSGAVTRAQDLWIRHGADAEATDAYEAIAAYVDLEAERNMDPIDWGARARGQGRAP